MHIESKIGAALLASPQQAKADQAVLLTAPVFDDGLPVIGAAVFAQVRRPDNGQYEAVALLDDGNPPDDTAADGVYVGTYQVPMGVTGRFEAIAEIAGTTLQGDPFVRQAATDFDVYDPAAEFNDPVDPADPLNLADAGRDDDDPADGLFDRIEVSADIDVYTAGDYVFFATVRTTTAASEPGEIGPELA